MILLAVIQAEPRAIFLAVLIDLMLVFFDYPSVRFNFLQNITIILIGKTETGNRFYITFIRTIVFEFGFVFGKVKKYTAFYG